MNANSEQYDDSYMTWNDWIAKASMIIPRDEAIEILLSRCYFDADENWLREHGEELIGKIDLEDVINGADNNVRLRSEGMPIPYITGSSNFYGRDFWLGLVGEKTLIPRPETEQIIDAVLSLAGVAYLPGIKATPSQLPDHPRILDVGTGSGCIAITLALELPQAKITACDISEEALYTARENAWSLGIEVKDQKDYDSARIASQESNGGYINIIDFKKSNLLDNIDEVPDLIVANLPYVDVTWDWLDKESLSYEPSIALYAADHGLKLIKELIDTANSKYLILEADPCQHKEIIAYAAKKGLQHLETRGFILTFYSPQA